MRLFLIFVLSTALFSQDVLTSFTGEKTSVTMKSHINFLDIISFSPLGSYNRSALVMPTRLSGNSYMISVTVPTGNQIDALEFINLNSDFEDVQSKMFSSLTVDENNFSPSSLEKKGESQIKLPDFFMYLPYKSVGLFVSFQDLLFVNGNATTENTSFSFSHTESVAENNFTLDGNGSQISNFSQELKKISGGFVLEINKESSFAMEITNFLVSVDGKSTFTVNAKSDFNILGRDTTVAFNHPNVEDDDIGASFSFKENTVLHQFGFYYTFRPEKSSGLKFMKSGANLDIVFQTPIQKGISSRNIGKILLPNFISNFFADASLFYRDEPTLNSQIIYSMSDIEIFMPGKFAVSLEIPVEKHVLLGQIMIPIGKLGMQYTETQTNKWTDRSVTLNHYNTSDSKSIKKHFFFDPKLGLQLGYEYRNLTNFSTKINFGALFYSFEYGKEKLNETELRILPTFQTSFKYDFSENFAVKLIVNLPETTVIRSALTYEF